MNRYEEAQYYLVAYKDALSIIAEKCDEEPNISAVERHLLLLGKNLPSEIAERIAGLVKYNRIGKRNNKLNFDCICDQIDELYYLVSIADNHPSANELANEYRPERANKLIFPGHDSYRIAIKANGNRSDRFKNGIIKISEMSNGVKYIYENNPYCIFGMPCSSEKSDFQSLIDRYKREDREYLTIYHTTALDLKNVEIPNRSISRLQVVADKMEESSYNLPHRWLWFKRTNKCDYALSDLKIHCNEDDNFDYDDLISFYISSLLKNPKIVTWHDWRPLLLAVDSLYKKDDWSLYKVLEKSLPPNERYASNYTTVVKSFRDMILKPYIMNIEYDEDRELISRFNHIKESNFSFSQKLLEIISSYAITRAEEKIYNVISADDAEYSLDYYFDVIDLMRVKSISATQYEKYLGEKISKKDCLAILKAANILNKRGSKDKAYKYIRIVFPLCSYSQQRNIIKSIPFRMQDFPEDIYTISDCKKAVKEFVKIGDSKNTVKWQIRAANKGDAESQYYIGTYYENGLHHFNADARIAINWFMKAANQDYGPAFSKLAEYYYDGIYPCDQDIQKAEDYWIYAVILIHRDSDIKCLNEKFPGWEKSNHRLLSFSMHDYNRVLKPMAEIGVPSAECWYGYYSYYGENGCSKNKTVAKGYLLLSSAHGYYASNEYLENLFNIPTDKISVSQAMYKSAIETSRQTHAELRFRLLYESYTIGNKSAARELGLCYQNGFGTDVNVDMANQLLLIGTN